MTRPPLDIAFELLGRYGLTVFSVESVAGGYDACGNSWRLDSDHGSLVLRVDRGLSLQAAGWLAEMQQRIAKAGVPCCPPLAADDGTTAFLADGGTVTLREFVAGVQLDRNDPTQLSSAGSMLATIHLARSGFVTQRPEPSMWPCGSLPDDRDPRTLRDPLLDAWHREFTKRGGGPVPRGLVRGDFCAENIVCAHRRIAAVIDWGGARLGLLACEVAWATWELGHNDDYGLDITRARTFLAGYRDVGGPLKPGLREALIPLMRVQLRGYARAMLQDDDPLYAESLRRAFGRLSHQLPGPLLDP